MPAIASAPRARPPLSLWIDPEPCLPPSSSVVGAVLAFGDLREEQEDGTTLIRFSPARLTREDMRLLLRGPDRRRALDVSIVWDEGEGEVLRVIDLGPLRPPTGPGRGRNRYAEARMRVAAAEMLAA